MSSFETINPTGPLGLFAGVAIAKPENGGAAADIAEKRIKVLEELHLRPKELMPFREKIVDMRDRRITLANDILIEFKKYENAKLLKMLKMVGLIIGVALLALIVLAAFGGAIVGTLYLANFAASYLTIAWVKWLLLALLIAGEIPLLAIGGCKMGQLLIALLSSGINEIGWRRDGSLDLHLMLKVREWHNWEDRLFLYLEEGLELAEKNARESLPLLMRLNDPNLVEAVINGYVRHEIQKSDDFMSRIELGDNQRVFKEIEAHFDDTALDGVLAQACENDLVKKIMPILPQLIKEYDKKAVIT